MELYGKKTLESFTRAVKQGSCSLAWRLLSRYMIRHYVLMQSLVLKKY